MDYDDLDPYAGLSEDDVPLEEEPRGEAILPGVLLLDGEVVVMEGVHLTPLQMIQIAQFVAKRHEIAGVDLPETEPEEELSEEELLLQGWHGGGRVLDYTHPVPTADQSGADFLPQWEAREKHLREHKW